LQAVNSHLSAGLGLKPQHFDAARDCRADGLWFEIHPENYMVEGGPRLAWLQAVRAQQEAQAEASATDQRAQLEQERRDLEAERRALIERRQVTASSESYTYRSTRHRRHRRAE